MTKSTPKPASQAERSKYLSYILRHKPEKAKLTLDREGWVLLSELTKNTDFTHAELHAIVKADEKGRYSIDGWPEKIRANQGHSTSEVSLNFTVAVPPVHLYHGTVNGIVPTILKEGLKPMTRHHVHLSAEIGTARNVGGRRKGVVEILQVDCKTMLADGHKFFLSDNGVWLVPAVPAKYLTSLGV